MKAKRIYYIVSAILAFCCFMMFTAAAVYRINIAHLSSYQLILLGMALEIAILFFEIPTGVVADLKSRKLSVAIGFIVVGLGFLIEAMFVNFIIILIAQIIWGLGYTFISGALDAWISDEVDDKDIEQVILTGHQYSSLFNILGILMAMLIGIISIRLSIIISATLLISGGLWLKKHMPETNFKPTHHEVISFKKYIKQLEDGIKHIRNNQILFMLLFVYIAYGLYSEGIDRLYELHILKNFQLDVALGIQPIVAIGCVNGIIAVLGILVLRLIKKYTKDSLRSVIWLIGLTTIMMVGIVGFAFSPSIVLGVSSFIVFAVTRQGTFPLLNAMCLHHTPTEIKATVLSSFSQSDAIGQLLSGLLMAMIARVFGIKSAFLATIALLGIALYPLILLKYRLKRV